MTIDWRAEDHEGHGSPCEYREDGSCAQPARLAPPQPLDGPENAAEGAELPACPIHDFTWHPPEGCAGCPIHAGDVPPITCTCTPAIRQLHDRHQALRRAHTALAEQAGRDQAAIRRVLVLCTEVDDPTWRAPGTEVAARFRLAIAGEQQ